MGQAKNRGSFEFRKGQSIMRKQMEADNEQAEIRKAQEEFLVLWDSWSDDEKDAFRKKRNEELKKKQELAAIMGLIGVQL